MEETFELSCHGQLPIIVEPCFPLSMVEIENWKKIKSNFKILKKKKVKERGKKEEVKIIKWKCEKML